MLVGGDPRARIRHAETQALALAGFRRDDDDHASAIGELDGVADEIEQHLPEPIRIANDDRRHARVELHVEGEALRGRARLQRVDQRRDLRARVEGLLDQLEPAGLDPGEVEQVVDDPQQRVGGRSRDRNPPPLLGRQVAVERQLRHRQDPVHRRAQLVADVRDEFALGPARILGAEPRLVQVAGALRDAALEFHVAAREPAQTVPVAAGQRSSNANGVV